MPARVRAKRQAKETDKKRGLLRPARMRANVPLGFGPVVVGPGEQLEIGVVVQLPYRVDRILVGESIAAHFSLKDLKIGRKSQWASLATVPAVLFARHEGLPVRSDAAETGQTVTLIVKNESVESQTFVGGALGTTLE